VANILGERRARPCVIAIDGIDHAARSGTGSDTLLASLVPPNEIPPHVAFLIGGQPPEAYASYLTWLRVSTAGVRRIDLPRLTNEDTRDLLRARLPGKTELELENASRDIWQVVEDIHFPQYSLLRRAYSIKISRRLRRISARTIWPPASTRTMIAFGLPRLPRSR
jgi:hypothetical protein